MNEIWDIRNRIETESGEFSFTDTFVFLGVISFI